MCIRDRLMEEKAKGKTSTAIRKLMGLQPRTARVVTVSYTHLVPAVEQPYELGY